MFSHAISAKMELMYLAVNDREITMANVAAAADPLGLRSWFCHCPGVGLGSTRFYVDT